MTDRNRRRDRVKETFLDVATLPDYTVTDPEVYAELADGIGDRFDSARPNTEAIESALDGVSLPEAGALEGV